MKKFVILFLIIILSPSFVQARFRAGGAAYEAELASQTEILPTNPLYFFDILFEKINVLLTFSKNLQAKKLLDIAKERANELKILKQSATEQDINKSINDFNDSLKNLAQKVGEINLNSDAGKKFIADLQDPVKRNILINNLDKKLPPELQGLLKPLVTSVIENSGKFITQSQTKLNEAKESLAQQAQNKIKKLTQEALQSLTDYLKGKLINLWQNIKEKVKNFFKDFANSTIDNLFK